MGERWQEREREYDGGSMREAGGREQARGKERDGTGKREEAVWTSVR